MVCVCPLRWLKKIVYSAAVLAQVLVGCQLVGKLIRANYVRCMLYALLGNMNLPPKNVYIILYIAVLNCV